MESPAIPEIRAGEETLDIRRSADDTVTFIGRIRSPWGPGNCPKNIAKARESGHGAAIELLPGYERGLRGLMPGQGLLVLYWMHHARRDLIVQAPRHVAAPRGTFALRSPNRPNPITLSAVTITAIDPVAGRIGIDAIDCFDGTPVVDLKPWLATVDVPPVAATD